MKYQAYEEYKDSGVEWLGSIPLDWNALPLKLMTTSKVKDGPHETPKFIDEGVPFFSVDSIQNNQLLFTGSRYISREDHKKFSLKCLPKKGDVLLGKAASVGKVAYVDTDKEFNVWSPLAVITPKNEAFGRFIFYSLQSTWLQAQCEVLSNSNTQKNLSMQVIDNITFAFPMSEEAGQIANFLDHETAKIDTLIEKQQQLIKLLKEKRQAVISHAVTKGLNPNGPMRDSGVEWLGEVPEHWVTKVKLTNVSESNRGSFVNDPFGSDLLASELREDGVPVIYIRDLKRTGYKRKSTVCVTLEKAEQLDVCKVKSGDVLISKVGDPPGEACVYPKNEADAIITQDVIRIRVDRKVATPFFLTMLLNSDFGQMVINDISVEGTRKRVSLGDFKATRFILPVLNEQNDIVNYVDGKCKKINHLIARSLSAVDLIKERRTALISAAVTGKIDVRNWVAPAHPCARDISASLHSTSTNKEKIEASV